MTPIQVLARRLAGAAALAAMLAAAGQGLAQQPPPQPPEREVILQNETDFALMQFHLAPRGEAARGPDRLGADIVPPGTTYRIRLGRGADCVFDATATFADGSEAVRRGHDICRTPRLVFGDPALPTLEAAVANRSRVTLRELYVSSRGAAAWGPDRLGRGTIAPGGGFALRIRTRDCVFDLRAVYADAREEVRERVDLCATRGVAFDRSAVARPPTRRIVVANRHLATVQQVYLSASSDPDWGPGRLGNATLAVDEDTTVEMEGGCEADLRVVFANGAAEERRAVDICEATRVVLRPGWVVAERLDEEDSVPAPVVVAPAATLRLRNAGPLPIVEIYTGPPGGARGEDRLGEDTLPVGATIEVEPVDPDACAADLIVVFRDGREVAERGVDLCAGEEIEVR
jgi:hypothetical protein